MIIPHFSFDESSDGLWDALKSIKVLSKSGSFRGGFYGQKCKRGIYIETAELTEQFLLTSNKVTANDVRIQYHRARSSSSIKLPRIEPSLFLAFIRSEEY